MFWREAIQFANLIYQLTSKFPERERFGLTNQMRRAAVSVFSNLAEGSSRMSRVDFGRFVEIATSSLFEVVSQAKVSLDQHFLTQPDYECIINSAGKQCRMLSGLRRSLDQA